MAVYLAIYIVPALLALTRTWRQGRLDVIALGITAFLTLFIGYRYFIGVDWVTYEFIFLDNSRGSLVDALGYGDSAYSAVNWTVAWLGGQVWHVNLICAAIFAVALVIFCKTLPRPALAATVAVPTLIVITAMGYTRQATAVACIMLAFRHFQGDLNWRWLGWLCLAILFHKSAVIMLPIFIVTASRQRWLSIAVGGLVLVALLSTVVLQNLQDVLSLYFEGDIQSSGTLPRIAVGAFAGLTFAAIRDKEIFGVRHALIRNLAIVMVTLLPLYFVIPSDTVLDRIGILLVPFQGAILAGLAASCQKNPVAEKIVTLLVIASYAAMYLVWLFYATFANYWIPYENVLFVDWP